MDICAASCWKDSSTYKLCRIIGNAAEKIIEKSADDGSPPAHGMSLNRSFTIPPQHAYTLIYMVAEYFKGKIIMLACHPDFIISQISVNQFWDDQLFFTFQ